MSDIVAMNVASFIENQGGSKAVAERLGLARTTVSDWKRIGYVPPARLGLIRTVFGIDVEVAIALVTRPTAKDAA